MKRRGAVDPITLAAIVLIGLAVGAFGATWKPFDFLKAKPPTEELTKLQTALAAAQADAEKARTEKAAAVQAERAKLEQQVRSAQEDNAGTVAAISAAPAGPEVKLAGQMAQRVDMKLAVAIGDLPKANREAIVALIEAALNGKQAEFDRAMAQRDAEFAALRAERDQAKAEVAVTTIRATKAEETAKTAQVRVTTTTEQVKVFAAKADAKEREAGSLGGALASARSAVLWVVGVYAFLAYVLPGLIKHMQPGWVKDRLRDVSGYTCGPLLYHDAKAKIAAALNIPTPPAT